MNKFIGLAIIYLLVLMVCCQDNFSISDRLNMIKKIGDTNPTLALAMMDSINLDIRKESEPVQKKYDLLLLRLKDKADISATSDISTRQLVSYYDENGTGREKQETYYYAGSVYRDLQDMPRALDYFYKSMTCTSDLGPDCDSLMLRNTYSNICVLQYNIQDYRKALYYAQKEYELSEELHLHEATQMMHVGVSYLYLDSIAKAKHWCDKAYKCILETDTTANNEFLYSLIYSYATIGDTIMAGKCYSMLQNQTDNKPGNYENLNLGTYYVFSNQTDSAIQCYKRVINDGTDILSVYDASKELFLLYKKAGDDKNTIRYGDLFIQTSDSVDLGKRQELAATVNNQFQYHLDERRERETINEKERFRSLFVISTVAVIAIFLLAATIIIYRRNIHLKELLKLSRELHRQTDDKKKLMAEIGEKEKELKDAQDFLKERENELEDTKRQLDTVNEQLAKAGDDIQNKENLLSEKMAQNQRLLNMLHQSQFESNAEDVVHAIRQSSKGTKNMSAAEWKQLYMAVDELYPTFKELMLKELGTFSEKEMQVCYLMLIGLTKTQILNITGLSRATIWRWCKKFTWMPPVRKVR